MRKKRNSDDSFWVVSWEFPKTATWNYDFGCFSMGISITRCRFAFPYCDSRDTLLFWFPPWPDGRSKEFRQLNQLVTCSDYGIWICELVNILYQTKRNSLLLRFYKPLGVGTGQASPPFSGCRSTGRPFASGSVAAARQCNWKWCHLTTSVTIREKNPLISRWSNLSLNSGWHCMKSCCHPLKWGNKLDLIDTHILSYIHVILGVIFLLQMPLVTSHFPRGIRAEPCYAKPLIWTPRRWPWCIVVSEWFYCRRREQFTLPSAQKTLRIEPIVWRWKKNGHFGELESWSSTITYTVDIPFFPWQNGRRAQVRTSDGFTGWLSLHTLDHVPIALMVHTDTEKKSSFREEFESKWRRQGLTDSRKRAFKKGVWNGKFFTWTIFCEDRS